MFFCVTWYEGVRGGPLDISWQLNKYKLLRIINAYNAGTTYDAQNVKKKQAFDTKLNLHKPFLIAVSVVTTGKAHI